ncbi:hypothetical protein J763_3765 [Acinetobacter baumannii 24845_10]|nr:hypothetical protein J763_3765 [Acinetobacter baumannii 24845_10]
MHSFIGTLIAFYLGTNTNFIEGSLCSKSDLDFEDYKDQFFYF